MITELTYTMWSFPYQEQDFRPPFSPMPNSSHVAVASDYS